MQIETQASIAEWGYSAFTPAQNEPTARYKRCLEEMVELGVALGITFEEILQVAWISYRKSVDKGDFNKPDEVADELADSNITLNFLADVMNVDLLAQTADRMARNRAKSPEHWKEREDTKKKLGL